MGNGVGSTAIIKFFESDPMSLILVGMIAIIIAGAQSLSALRLSLAMQPLEHSLGRSRYPARSFGRIFY
jgi:hypothetical protein